MGDKFTIHDLDMALIFTGGLTLFLIVSFFKYDRSNIFRTAGDLFLSLLRSPPPTLTGEKAERGRYDLLVFALIPAFLFVMTLVLRAIKSGWL